MRVDKGRPGQPPDHRLHLVIAFAADAHVSNRRREQPTAPESPPMRAKCQSGLVCRGSRWRRVPNGVVTRIADLYATAWPGAGDAWRGYAGYCSVWLGLRPLAYV
jgi:hypothetical protein